MNSPAWRIWLITALVAGWGILTIRFIQKGQWLMAVMTALLFVFNAYTLWQLTRKDR